MEGMTRTGTTPFERAEIGRAKSQLLLVTHYAIKELLLQLDECEAQISKWKETAEQFNKGEASKEDMEFELRMATQALKDKKLFEEALTKICENSAIELGMEA